GLDHVHGAVPPLGLTLGQQVEVLQLRRREELGGTVGTCGDARTTTDACGGVHRRVGDVLRNGNRVPVDRAARVDADVATRLDDRVERAAVDDEVLDHRERGGAPGFDGDVVTVLVLAHVQLAGRRVAFGTVGLTVDHHPARSADALAAVVVEGD